MHLLLDTHTFIWWDNAELPAAVVRRIERAEKVYLSAVIAWEIAIKSALGKLAAKGDVRDALAQYDFIELPVTIAHADELRTLPHLHRDPFDRLLIAQARSEDLAIVSADAEITRYKVPVVWD